MSIYPPLPLPMPGPYDPNAGPPLGGAPGALTSNNYLNQQLFNVGAFDGVIAGSVPPPNNNLLFPGSPLDFAQNYLNPNMANINNQINGFLAQYPPQQGGPGALPAGAGGEEGGGPNVGGALAGAAGGAAIGAVVGGPVGAAVGGVIGGIAGLFG